jgi:hypothetical protein
VSPVLDPEQLVRRPAGPAERARLVAAVVVGVLAFGALATALRGPDFVDAVTVVNDSPYDVHVEVRRPGGPVLGLGTVPRERSIRFDSVLDQGTMWSFTFAAAGVDGGTVEVPRATLEQDGWTVAIPTATSTRFERAGVPPSPATRTDPS